MKANSFAVGVAAIKTEWIYFKRFLVHTFFFIY